MQTDWRKSFEEEFPKGLTASNQKIRMVKDAEILAFIEKVEADAIERTQVETKKGENWRKGYHQGYDEAVQEVRENIKKMKKPVHFRQSSMPREYNNALSDLLSSLSATVTTKEYPPCTDPTLSEDCSGCSDPHSEGTHQGCTKQHGHVGCDLSVTTK